MQNITLIKENINKLVLHHRKTLINEVVYQGLLKDAFESNRLPKDLTEGQLLVMMGECLLEDGNFILEHYKILTHPNPTPKMLNEGILGAIIKKIIKWAGTHIGRAPRNPGGATDLPNLPKKPNRGTPWSSPDPDGRPRTPGDRPYNPEEWDIDPDGPYGHGPGDTPGPDDLDESLIKQNVHKLISYHRKTIINEVVQTGMLREAFGSNRLPKNLTEEQFLFMVIEGLAKDSDFILENYKILTHPNLTPEMLNEGNGSRGFGRLIRRIIDSIRGLGGDPEKNPAPRPTPPSTNPAPMPQPTVPGATPTSGIVQNESLSDFNHNMRHLMESNHQIDQNLLHSMLNQVNESKYLLELAIQRNQVNRIIDRI